MRIQSEVIGVRLAPRARGLLEEFAQRNALVNKAGLPNLSAAIRTIIELSAAGNDNEAVYRAAYANARADLIQSVSSKYGILISELSKL